jgi:hypothetical protein
MFHNFVGVLMVKPEKIMKPDENKDLGDDDKWGETMFSCEYLAPGQPKLWRSIYLSQPAQSS